MLSGLSQWWTTCKTVQKEFRETINWWAFKNNAILVRCTQLMTARWLLNEIMDEMGEVNCGRLADCFKIIIRNLLTEPQVIIVDEVDYLAIDSMYEKGPWYRQHYIWFRLSLWKFVWYDEIYGFFRINRRRKRKGISPECWKVYF